MTELQAKPIDRLYEAAQAQAERREQLLGNERQRQASAAAAAQKEMGTAGE
jgi:hypothetical protein